MNILELDKNKMKNIIQYLCNKNVILMRILILRGNFAEKPLKKTANVLHNARNRK